MYFVVAHSFMGLLGFADVLVKCIAERILARNRLVPCWSVRWVWHLANNDHRDNINYQSSIEWTPQLTFTPIVSEEMNTKLNR